VGRGDFPCRDWPLFLKLMSELQIQVQFFSIVMNSIVLHMVNNVGVASDRCAGFVLQTSLIPGLLDVSLGLGCRFIPWKMKGNLNSRKIPVSLDQRSKLTENDRTIEKKVL
jgi:hypothetical protein